MRRKRRWLSDLRIGTMILSLRGKQRNFTLIEACGFEIGLSCELENQQLMIGIVLLSRRSDSVIRQIRSKLVAWLIRSLIARLKNSSRELALVVLNNHSSFLLVRLHRRFRKKRL